MKQLLFCSIFSLLIISIFNNQEYTEYAFNQDNNIYNLYYIELDSMIINTKNIYNYFNNADIITLYSDDYNILVNNLYLNTNNISLFEKYIKDKMYQNGYSTLASQVLVSGVKLKGVTIYTSSDNIERLFRKYKFDYKKI